MPYAESTKLARKGRNGDTMLGHLTPGDVVISRERQERDPAFKAKLREIMGDDLDRFTAGSAWNAKNPSTGLAEFAESAGADPGGGGDTSGGSGNADPGNTGGAGLGGLGVGGVDPSGTAGAAAANAQAAEAEAAAAANATGAAPSDISIERTSSTVGNPHGLVGAALSSAGVNLDPEIDTSSIDKALFGQVSPAGAINTNAPSTAIGTAGTIAGIPGLGLVSDVTGIGTGIGKALGLASPNTTLGEQLGRAGPGPGGTGGPGTGDVAGGGDPWAGIFADITRDLQPPAAPTSPTIPASTTTPAAPTAAAALANPSQILNQGGFSPETIALLSDYQRQQLGL